MKKNILITERQLGKVVKKVMNENASFVMSFDEFMKHKNKNQQYHCGYEMENKCIKVADGNYQIDLGDKFHEKHKIPNGVGGAIYHDGVNVYFCPDFGDDRPQRTIQVY
jgi:hypothetical protein